MTRSVLPTRLAQIGAIIALATCANAARAADLAPSPPPAFTTSPWAGLYAGSIYGFGFGSFKSTQTASRTASQWGQTGGALIGYNFQSGPFVFGPEADITLNSIRARNPGVAPGLVPNIADTIDTSRLRARLGYDLGQFLPYVAAGVAFNEAYQYNSPLTQYGQTREETGLTLGAGLEWRFLAPFLGPLTLRGEYVYDAYPTATFDLDGGPARTRSSTQIFRVALIARAGDSWRPPASAPGVPDWSGAYAGLLVGDLWAQPRTSLGGATTTYTANGPAFGMLVGRNFMFGQWMLGAEGSTELADARATGAQPSVAAASFRDYLETDLRGRAGYAIGRFLPYVAAGVDWGFSEQADLATGSVRGRVPSESLTAGGGLEYMVSDRWSARVEYLFYSSLGNEDTGLDGLPLSQSRRAQSIRLGVAYHFH